MSQYLCFKKNGVAICSFGKSTYLFRAFDWKAPCDEFKIVLSKHIEEGLRRANDLLTIINEDILDHEKVLEGLHDYESRHNIVEAIRELGERRKGWEKAVIQIEMLEEIMDTSEFEDELCEPTPLEWGIF